MQLFYLGKDITDSIKILAASVSDKAANEADLVEIAMSDTEKFWRQWAPNKGDTISVKHKGFSSGIMYLDLIQDLPGSFILGARSTPLNAKTSRTRTWENVRFLEVANDIARNYGFSLTTYGITNYLYERIDQIETSDLRFLSDLCIREGYCLKISDKKIIIYNEVLLENSAIVRTVSEPNFREQPSFKTVSDDIYSVCSIKYLDKNNSVISFDFAPVTAPFGPIYKPNMRVSNIGEAQRFTRGLLRSKNKWETFGDICLELDTGIAAGNMIGIIGMGTFSGKYFVHSCTHMLTANRSRLRIRKTLEGY